MSGEDEEKNDRNPRGGIPSSTPPPRHEVSPSGFAARRPELNSYDEQHGHPPTIGYSPGGISADVNLNHHRIRSQTTGPVYDPRAFRLDSSWQNVPPTSQHSVSPTSEHSVSPTDFDGGQHVLSGDSSEDNHSQSDDREETSSGIPIPSRGRPTSRFGPTLTVPRPASRSTHGRQPSVGSSNSSPSVSPNGTLKRKHEPNTESDRKPEVELLARCHVGERDDHGLFECPQDGVRLSLNP
ncbi:hypothetical protein T439DRAFT_34039 [Meredithblackwellia eburnea MCA 4105]